MTALTGAAVLARSLARLGVERIFTLSGNQILSLYDACLDHGLALTDTRHEAAAGHMAEAWARLRGQPGVCLVSAGPGHTNTITAIANALWSETPVLWLSGGGDLANDGRGGFQEMDQVALAAPVCKAAWRVERAGDLPDLLARAWRTMLEGRPGPVHLTLPADLLARPITAPPEIDPAIRRLIPQPADSALVAEAMALLVRAERPLILASPSAARGAAGAALEALIDQTNIPALAVESPRGLTDPAWHDLGAAVPHADAILLLAPQDYAIAFAGPRAFGPDAHLIQVAPAAAELGRNRPVEIGLVGDAATVLFQLSRAAGDRNWPVRAWRDELTSLRARGRARLAEAEWSEAAPIHPLRLAAEVRAALPPGASVSLDGGEFGQWARWAFGDADCTTLVNGKFGMIGPAIPFAIGAALARPEQPSVALLGDGTFGYHALEFDTAVRHGIPIVAIVGNDAGWAAERHRQVAAYGPERVVASDLLPARYDEVVRALGGVGEFVQSPAEIAPALRRALASRRPACVNVLIQSIQSPAAPV
jgi:acetolactate synthase-1/2/3 large subunit